MTLHINIEANGENGAAALNVSLESRENVRVAGPEAFEIPLKPAAMKQIFSGAQQADTLVTQLPDTARITEVKVQVNSGLLGAALNAASVLVSYPYGCTEQLVHATIPNLVLMDLVRRAGNFPGSAGAAGGSSGKGGKKCRSRHPSCSETIQCDASNGTWIFQAIGKGHGQGLSVDKARTLAGSGTSAAAILRVAYK